MVLPPSPVRGGRGSAGGARGHECGRIAVDTSDGDVGLSALRWRVVVCLELRRCFDGVSEGGREAVLSALVCECDQFVELCECFASGTLFFCVVCVRLARKDLMDI